MCNNESVNVNELVKSTRKFREILLSDPYRPQYHFVAPESICMPFDPNGAIYWKGKYHLCYIYLDEGKYCWGHASSIDLLHWKTHPLALVPAAGDVDIGIFSGGAFVNKNNVPTIIYHGVEAGNCIATADDDELNHWTKLPTNPIVPNIKEGNPLFGKASSWDPHGWLEGDTYFAIFGGDKPATFKSKDLVHWEYSCPFVSPEERLNDPYEDYSCPDYFRLGNLDVFMFISHQRGLQYYLGKYKDGRFHPEHHARMNWPGGQCFASESLIDSKGRRIFWAWVVDTELRKSRDKYGWSGIMSLPRVLSAGDDGMLKIEFAEELKMLRLNHRKYDKINIISGKEFELKDVKGSCLELMLEIEPGKAKELGVKVFCSPDNSEQTVISFNPAEKTLKTDAVKSTLRDDIFYALRIIDQVLAQDTEGLAKKGEEIAKLQWTPKLPDDVLKSGESKVQSAPFELKPGENLKLNIFIDKSIIEVYANGRQCLTQRVYPSRNDSIGIKLFSTGADTLFKSVDAWDMAPSNNW